MGLQKEREEKKLQAALPGFGSVRTIEKSRNAFSVRLSNRTKTLCFMKANPLHIVCILNTRGRVKCLCLATSDSKLIGSLYGCRSSSRRRPLLLSTTAWKRNFALQALRALSGSGLWNLALPLRLMQQGHLPFPSPVELCILHALTHLQRPCISHFSCVVSSPLHLAPQYNL